MGASLRAERHENVPNTVEHHARKSQKNKAGHASTNHEIPRARGFASSRNAPLYSFHFVSHWFREGSHIECRGCIKTAILLFGLKQPRLAAAVLPQ
jgi:hypothetical protein